MRATESTRVNKLAQPLSLLAAAFLACGGLTGCVAVGYSSGGGWFIWPGGLGLVVLIVIVLLVMRRR